MIDVVPKKKNAAVEINKQRRKQVRVKKYCSQYQEKSTGTQNGY